MSEILLKNERSNLFHLKRRMQPYKIKLLGIDLLISEDVFPPDVGSTSIYLANKIPDYKSCNYALDMGCGCGLLAFCMRQCGIPFVYGVDIHKPAVDCANLNLSLNSNLAPINFLYSNLFSKIDPGIKFDLIVFNHPYYPTIGEPVFGDNPDGGKEILINFFSSMRDFCHIDTKIILPYSDISGVENDPKNIIAGFLDLTIKTLMIIKDEIGTHQIYEVSLKREI